MSGIGYLPGENKMASALNLVCYNMHGFKNGINALNDLCLKADIISVEEHWLAPFDLRKIVNFSDEFQGFGWSAMSDKISSGFLTGRPFGGLGILIRKSLNVHVEVLAVMHNCRVAWISCTFSNGYKIVFLQFTSPVIIIQLTMTMRF